MKQSLTNAELDVLAILWDKSESTVREVHDVLCTESGNERVYTTTLKTMQLMFEKGLLQRRKQGRQHVYKPSVDRQQAQRTALKDTLKRLFGGNRRDLILQALNLDALDDADLEAARQILEKESEE